jgi:CDGSH-type Zn-finger protein
VSGSSSEEVVIVPYQDGPYLIRGPVTVRDQRGEAIAVSRRPIALCRCGKSRIRPFCDGTHQLIHFQAPSEPERSPASEPPRLAAPTSSAVRAPAAGLISARRALRSAQVAVKQALQAVPPTADQASISSAQSLVVSALLLLDRRRAEQASADGALFLIHGALQALRPVASTGHELASRATAELQRAGADLEDRP